MNSFSEGSIDYHAYYIEQKRKSKFIAMALGAATMISVVFLTFAFTQKQKADQLQAELSVSQAEVERIRVIAEEQQKITGEQTALAESLSNELSDCKARCK
jgi:hypothetical protein